MGREPDVWRALSGNIALDAIRVAFPSEMLWHDRITVTPMYHELSDYHGAVPLVLPFAHDITLVSASIAVNRDFSDNFHASGCGKSPSTGYRSSCKHGTFVSSPSLIDT